MSDYEPVGVGIIGAGGWARPLAEAVEKSSKLRLVSCYDPVNEAAAAFAKEHSCGNVGLDELLADSAVEGVIIASPNHKHRENAVAAAEAGKHVFVEKPIANDIPDGLAMIEACRRRSVILSVGHDSRRMGGHRKMKAMIEAGDIGTPITAEADFSHSGGMSLTGSEWRSSREACPALPLMQLGVHFADTLHYLLGDITEVSSFMTHVAIPADNDDATVSILKFQAGLLGYLGSNYASPAVFYVNVYGTGGNLLCEFGEKLKYRGAGDKDYRDVPTNQVQTRMEELEEFADCVRTGDKPEVDGETALKALAMVRAAIESNRIGRPVKLADLL